jgi:hypothetical protein
MNHGHARTSLSKEHCIYGSHTSQGPAGWTLLTLLARASEAACCPP